MNGTRFLEVLSYLGYPEASSLNPSDFDTMFDGTPENKEFMHLFCSLGSQNVLSEEEHQAYHALEVSGKPILTEKVLEQMELLKSSAGPEGEEEEEEEEEEPEGRNVEQLQQELEELRRHQRLRQRRLHQLQGLRRARDDHASALADYTQSQIQSEGGEGGDTVKAIARENMATNAALHDLKEEVERLQSLTVMNEGVPEVQQQEKLMEQCAGFSAALLCQLPLHPYLKKVQLTHHSIMDLYKRRSSLLEEQRGVVETKVDEAEGEGETQHTRREMAKLQTAHMLIHGQLLQARAEEAGAIASKEWLCQQKHPNMKPSDSDSDSDAAPAVAKECVCSALWRRTQQLCSALLRGHAHEQGERAQRHALLQEGLLGELLQQKAQLDLLHRALGTERQGHAHAHTRSVARGLREEAVEAADRSKELENLQENAPQPDPILSATEPTVQRLLQVYEAPEKTEGWLAGAADISSVASERRAELQRLGEAEGEAEAERRRLVSGLERDSRRLKRWVEPQPGSGHAASPAPHTSQLCPSSQELTRVVRELEQQSGSLYKHLQEVALELSSKRTQLERSATLRRGRELYTLFHLDPATLIRLVEDQEKRE